MFLKIKVRITCFISYADSFLYFVILYIKFNNCEELNLDKQILFDLLKISLNAYSNVQSCRGCNKIIYIQKVSDIECYARIFDNTVIISFRGTDSKQDIINDLNVIKTQKFKDIGKNIYVHSGFYNAYSQVIDKIHIIIANNKQTNNIIFSGHSYGAALCVLCAFSVYNTYNNVSVEVALFGCPRVGNRVFKKYYNNNLSNTYRVENGNDFVTKLPFKFFGFCHVGQKIKIGHIRLPFIYSYKSHSGDSYVKEYLKKINI